MCTNDSLVLRCWCALACHTHPSASLISRNEPAAASGSRLFMWGCHPTEPSVVPQDGTGSESHAATESGPTTNPTPGAKPRGTPQLPVQHRPQRMASTCQHLHQQQVKPINDSPNSMRMLNTLFDPAFLLSVCTPSSPSPSTPHSQMEECTLATTT